MHKFSSKKPQLFLGAENFFLKHLFYRFNKCFVGKESHFSSLILKKAWSLTVLVIPFCCQLSWAQQEPQFSQNMFNSLSVNPAFAGSSEMINLMLDSRQQWNGLGGNPKTTVFGADAAISPFGIQSGIGLNGMIDKLGYLEIKTLTLSYSVIIGLKTGNLGLGLSTGFYNHVLDPSSGGWETGESEYHTESDPLLEGLDSKVSGSTADFGIGAYYKSDRYYAGVSITHLFSPTPKFDNDNYYYYLKRSYYVTGGYNFALKDKPVVFHPSIFIITDGVSFQTDLNVNAVYNKRYWGGLSYRLQDAIVVLGGIELKTGLKIGYSYDIPVSSVAINFKGGHEVTLGYTFEMNFDKKSKRYRSVRYL